jgi:hypothetical protein
MMPLIFWIVRLSSGGILGAVAGLFRAQLPQILHGPILCLHLFAI